MRKFFVRLLCCFIPSRDLRHTIRQRLSQKNTVFLSDIEPYRVQDNHFIIFSYSKAIHHPTTTNICLNMGDYVQSVATKLVIKKLFKQPVFKYEDRDNIINFQDNKKISYITIYQGFFPSGNLWLPNKYIYPVFIGFHLGGGMEYLQQENGSETIFKRFYNANKEYFSAKTIGCRDKRTLVFCQKLGLTAYFSRCLTLTLPKRVEAKTQTKVFVSVFPSIFDSVMDLCNSRGISDVEISTAEVNLDDYKDDNYKSVCKHDFMPDCEQYLEKFKNEARLVITDRIHVAAPCIAMGIPTVVIKRSENDPRYDIFDGIVKCYSEKELLNKEIDLDVAAPDIEKLKNYMIENVNLTIKDEVYNSLNKQEKQRLQFIRQQIAEFQVGDKE